MKWTLPLYLGLTLALFGPAGGSYAQSGALPDLEPKVAASFIPERKSVAPGESVTVALREVIRKDWHTYWINPGDSGAPTEIRWHLPPGWEAASIQWPYPKRLPVGPLMNFGYEDSVSLLVDVKAPADARPGETVTLDADVNWLVCSDVCIPEETKLSLPLAISAELPPPDRETEALFAEARAKLPHASPWQAVYDADDKRFALLVQSPELASARPRDAVFYPYSDGYAEAAAPQKVGTTSAGLVIESETGWMMNTAEKRGKVDKIGGILVLTGTDGRTDALAFEAAPGIVPATAVILPGVSDVGLFQALLFAVLGGLILNLMPCVFPVLSMKALALAAKREKMALAKISALAYGAGVLVSFVGLAIVLMLLRAGGEAIGWGFQLQHPLFVTLLALLMFAVGLNLAGLFEIGGAGLANAGGRFAGKGGVVGSFFTGVLAVVVATPCTAPFMGAAMGFALTQDIALSLAVFVALGVGFALPFMALGFSPRLLRALPRPGAWMTTLRQILAFPMFGAAIWLVWVLSFQAGSDGVLAALAAALALAFALWAYGMSQKASGRGRAAGLATALVALVGVAWMAPYAGVNAPAASTANSTTAKSVLDYEPYSVARLEALRTEGRPVFVNATAAWCITCLVNERVALSGPGLKRAFADRNVAALKADWTNQDPEITALLAQQGRSGVPLYLYFPPGVQSPVVLPQLLTESIVVAALDR